ncbi:DUF6713 family protein [Cucumibacter marinus]|uniref:DUF6713 family protein n=1 Tax=Cucumibacter marinus TaxID=1121252 RepID=UPI0004106DE5|nr:DUF6713 family protein [Cucumibacter marinus]
MLETVFTLSVALIVTHEIDAVARHEWRVLPLTAFLPEKAGFAVFVLAHVPLIWLALWGGYHAEAGTAALSRLLIAGSCVVHVGLHFIYRKHPAYEFDNPLSQSLIWGAGAAGAAYLAGATFSP